MNRGEPGGGGPPEPNAPPQRAAAGRLCDELGRAPFASASSSPSDPRPRMR